MSRPKVFLTGGDQIGWAIDEDIRLTRAALGETVEFTGLDRADVVHCAWWDRLLQIDPALLAGKRVICHVPGEPRRYLAVPAHRKVVPLVGLWIARSRQGQHQLAAAGLAARMIPYTVDAGLFRPLENNDLAVAALRSRLQAAEDRYIVGNFHRDTEGADLRSPKRVKGPDIFAEIVRILRARGLPVHVLLAGPRRHWLRNRLREWNIPFTFMGQETDADDIRTNLLDRSEMNRLYALCDVYVVSSRTEGGPQSVMEAAAARCRIVSTPVGLAEDILEPAAIYRTAAEAAVLIARDMASEALSATVEPQYRRVLARHTPEAVRPLFQALYADIEQVPQCLPETQARIKRSFFQRASGRVGRALGLARRVPALCLWHTFFKPPYGGGNQFMLALRKALVRRGCRVLKNRVRRGVDAYLLNSVHFDIERFRRARHASDIRILHRIDGPIHLIRGYDREKDDLCFALNRELASATVVQSAWCLERIVEMGYQPVRPTIVHNAVDPDIFHPHGRIAFDPDRKVRLVSTSWSDNPRKGGPIYKWIEEHLDWDRFEFTFVGRASERFNRIRRLDPLPSEELAPLLRQHDIYITASRNDPCSNAVIEALACGLPVLYMNDGGHPELVGHGGLPFSENDDILPQIDRLVEHYKTFQRLIAVPTLDDVAGRYLELLTDIAKGT